MASKDKVKSRFQCTSCGADAAKWTGQCARCGAWETMELVVVSAAPSPAVARQGYSGSSSSGQLVTLSSVESNDLIRYQTGMPEFDRVLGGGMAVGGTFVLGGFPGSGKSTLLLQMACHVSMSRLVLYISGEETAGQIKDRAVRLGLPLDNLLVAVETDISVIESMIESRQPCLVIVDSIQTAFHPQIDSAPGSVTQVKNSAVFLNRVCKRNGASLVLVGHVTKGDTLAGPRALEHIVDAVLMLTSTDDARFRLLRAVKNRLGSTEELGVFAMTGTGLKVVPNPSAIFLSGSRHDAPGSVVMPLWEGSRPMLVEVQALADESVLNNPRRIAVGVDANRVAMLLAILHKGAGLQVQAHDIYINVVGGIEIDETACDLPVLLAVASSLLGRIIPHDVIVFGEVGLSGEVRPSRNGADRIKEASKLGFKRAVVPLLNCPREVMEGFDLYPVSTLAQAVAWLNEQTLAAAPVIDPDGLPAQPVRRARARQDA